MAYVTNEERITALEVQVRDIREDLSGINDKLDTLLALRNKGAGVFWLISALFGTGMIGFMTWLLDHARGH